MRWDGAAGLTSRSSARASTTVVAVRYYSAYRPEIDERIAANRLDDVRWLT